VSEPRGRIAVSSTLDDPILDPVTRGSSYIQAIAFRGKLVGSVHLTGGDYR
jgi:hypothetical protein